MEPKEQKYVAKDLTKYYCSNPDCLKDFLRDDPNTPVVASAGLFYHKACK